VIPKYEIHYRNFHGRGQNLIRFESKPPKEVRDRMKSHGFYWSSANQAWIADDRFIAAEIAPVIEGNNEQLAEIAMEKACGMYD
jgi:hypothetical protein